jgi:hypothetical protein
MTDEVKFSVFSDKGDAKKSVDLDTFIQLFVNHRPVYGIGKNNIENAFKQLFGETGNEVQLTRDELKNYLKNDGEPITAEELDEFMQLLVGEDAQKALKPIVSSDDFAEQILGFEEVEEGEEEEGEGEEAPGEMGQSQMRGNDVIPEVEGF